LEFREFPPPLRLHEDEDEQREAGIRILGHAQEPPPARQFVCARPGAGGASGPTMACITASSKAGRISWLAVWAMRIPTTRSLGSTQKCVPKAPLQPKLPS